MNRLLIRSGILLDPAQNIEGKRDLYIEEGIVKQVAEEITQVPEDTEIIDAAGCWVMPGFIDLHVHFRDPGFTYKEDIESGSLAAAKGGYTSVILMANTKPAVDNPETIRYVLDKGNKTGFMCTHVLILQKA